MKHLLTLVTAIIVSATIAYGQDQERTDQRRPGREGGGDFRERMQERMKSGRGGQDRAGGDQHGKGGSREDMMERLLSNPEMLEKLGLSDEDAEKLKGELHKLKVEFIELKAEMEKLGLEQARAMTSREVDEDKLMDLVEDMGKLRTKMAKIQIRKMMLFRKNIDPEKMKAMREQLHERMRSRDQEGRGGQDREGGSDRRRPGGDMRKRSRPDGESRDRGDRDEE